MILNIYSILTNVVKEENNVLLTKGAESFPINSVFLIAQSIGVSIVHFVIKGQMIVTIYRVQAYKDSKNKKCSIKQFLSELVLGNGCKWSKIRFS